MPRLTPINQRMAEGRDAAIDAWSKGRDLPACPYGRATKSALFWNDGAARAQAGLARAQAALEQVMRIGA